MTDDHTVLGRAVAILDCVVDAMGPLPLAELTRRAGLPKPTVRRIANALAERGLLAQTPDGYLPGQRLIDHGVQSAHRHGLALTVQPYLQDLHGMTRGQMAWVATMSQGQLMMAGSAFGRTHLQGMRKPWLTFSAIGPGMVLLASGRLQAAHDEELAEHVLASQFPPMTRYSVIDKSRMRALIDGARESGFAQETEQAVLGISCMAAAMRDSSGQLAGIIGVAGQCSAIEARGVGVALKRSALLLQHEIRSSPCDEGLELFNAPIFDQRTGIGYTWPGVEAVNSR